MNLLSEKYSKHLEVLGNADRMKIIELLSEKQMCVQDINAYIPMAQATLSYHLGLLKEIGFIDSTKDGKYVNYFVKVDDIKSYLKQFVSDFSYSLDRA